MNTQDKKTTPGKWIYSMGGTFDQASIKVETPQGLLTVAVFNTEQLRIAANITGEQLPEWFTPDMDEINARLAARAPELEAENKQLRELLAFYHDKIGKALHIYCTYILPDSDYTDYEAVQDLGSLLDNSELVLKMREANKILARAAAQKGEKQQ